MSNHFLDSGQFQKEVWGPTYWNFIQTIANQYPNHPDNMTKKRYYKFFIEIFPYFIPDPTSMKRYHQLINDFSISPFLDNRLQLIRWIQFIHNKIAQDIGKPLYSIERSQKEFWEQHKHRSVRLWQNGEFSKQELLTFSSITGLLFIIYFSYKNIQK